MAFIITRDGKPAEWIGKRYETEDAIGTDNAWVGLLKLQGQSVDYALKHGGYAIVEVPDDTWSDIEASALRKNALRQFSDHQCEGSRSIDMRVNCQACCLWGYQPSDKKLRDGDVRTDGPNVSNWQRDYVQAGITIRKAWLPLLRAALDGTDGSDNEPWRVALWRDVRTFGVNGKPWTS